MNLKSKSPKKLLHATSLGKEDLNNIIVGPINLRRSQNRPKSSKPLIDRQEIANSVNLNTIPDVLTLKNKTSEFQSPKLSLKQSKKGFHGIKPVLFGNNPSS